MGQTKLDKKRLAHYRQREILDPISEPGGRTCSYLARKFHVARGEIISDIRDLRMMGYPIQTFMKVEAGLYTAAFELTKVPKQPS